MIDLSQTRIGRPVVAPNKNCSATPGLAPHGGGVILAGLEGSAGLGGAGATAQGQIGAGAFMGQSGSLNTGSFATGAAAARFGPSQAGSPNQSGSVNPVVMGAYAGAGLGVFVTNATNVEQLGGPFQTLTLATPVGSISLSFGGGIWSASVTAGPGAVGAASGLTTNTRTSWTYGPC